MRKEIKIGIAILSFACCMVSSNAFAKKLYNGATVIRQTSAAESVRIEKLPGGVMRASEPLALTCAKLSGQINQDKDQLRSVLGYLSSNHCYSEPAASSHTCTALFTKQRNLEARIESNQRRARELGCR